MKNNNEMYSLEEQPRETSLHITDCYENTRNNDIPSNETSNKKHSAEKFKPFIGIFCTFIHTIFSQLTSVIVKKLWYISVCQLSLIRYTGVFVFSLPLTFFYAKHILGDKGSKTSLILKGIFASTSLVFKIAAYRYLQLIQASVVTSILPFVTAVLARIMLKEHFGVIQSICIVITICGVLLSIGLPKILVHNNNFHFDVNQLIGYATAFGYILCVSLSFIFLRKLKKTNFAVVMLYTGFIGIIENSVINASMFTFDAVNCGWDNFLCTMVGVIGFAGNWMVTVAMQHEPAGLVAVQKSSLEILVIAVFQIIFFHKYPDWCTTAGACLVLMSLTILGIKRWVEILPATSETRRKLKWILS